MYNSWAQAETVAYAQGYGAALIAGYEVRSAQGQGFTVKIPGSKMMLGYPAAAGAAGSGYLPPSQVVFHAKTDDKVVPLIAYFAARGIPIAGLMTWSIGWDHSTNWSFASAVAAEV